MPLPPPPPQPLRTKRPMRQLCPAAVPQLLFLLLEPTAEGGAGGGSSCPGTSLTGPSLLPLLFEACSGLRDWLSGSSLPFGGIPSGVQRMKPGLSRTPLFCLASDGEEGEEGHCSQSGTLDPPLSC